MNCPAQPTARELTGRAGSSGGDLADDLVQGEAGNVRRPRRGVVEVDRCQPGEAGSVAAADRAGVGAQQGLARVQGLRIRLGNLHRLEHVGSDELLGLRAATSVAGCVAR